MPNPKRRTTDNVDWDDVSHARRTDPDTSHETAALVKMNAQRFRVLGAYYSLPGTEMLDHEAYEIAGLNKAGWTHQRCSDLRRAGWIERCGKGITPANKPAYKCRITAKGIRAYQGWAVNHPETNPERH